MKLSLSGEFQDIECGLKSLLENHTFKILGERDYNINVRKLDTKSDSSLTVSTKNGLHIAYKNRNDFFRGLSVLLCNINEIGFEKQETALFEACSTMIDLSRNAVYTVKEMKRLLSYMALAGHNRCYLYMEDTYDLPGYPYFGYFRGKYSAAELKQIDDFAYSLGIEVIPCIQTLAHLKTTLKWGYAETLKDTDDILLVGEDATYRFIETMFSALKSTFRTNKIHIGMDEAMNLGTGNYLKKNGYHDQFQLMISHLNRVNILAQKHGLTPMMWDDMFYRSHDVNHEYYNLGVKLTDEDMKQVPPNVTLVYWDYYHNTESEYDQLLAKRDCFPNDIAFAGGIWRWMGYVPMYSKTFVTTNAALAACKKHKVKEIMATAWGDDGAETPIETIIPGLILYGEHCYGQETDENSVGERCRFLTGLSLSDFKAIEKLDILPNCENPNIKTRNPSKHIIYQDILLGAFDNHFDSADIVNHYTTCEKELLAIAQSGDEFQNMFEMYSKLAKVLARKCRMGISIREAYLKGDRTELNEIVVNALPQLKDCIVAFKKAFSKVWFSESKGYGFEVIDIRLGGLLSRIDTVIFRLTSYLAGEISTIEELEEQPLPFTQGAYSNESYACFNQYSHIATQNVLG